MVRFFPERMGTLLGLVFLDTNHAEEVPCVHLYQSPKLVTTVIRYSDFDILSSFVIGIRPSRRRPLPSSAFLCGWSIMLASFTLGRPASLENPSYHDQGN